MEMYIDNNGNVRTRSLFNTYNQTSLSKQQFEALRDERFNKLGK